MHKRIFSLLLLAVSSNVVFSAVNDSTQQEKDNKFQELVIANLNQEEIAMEMRSDMEQDGNMGQNWNDIEYEAWLYDEHNGYFYERSDYY